ncbi:TadE family protein [Thalassoglobus sp. JC818]|uniref:TadE/TadG family type IV pilus assembly protein n=1 Tax=Thalassoglobus sp. JC818 TaxID=3232136 RepID=UPI0034582073
MRNRRSSLKLTTSSASQRSGSVTLEFIVSVPVVFILLLAVLTFWFYSLAQFAATSALIEGTRQATLAQPSQLVLDSVGAANDRVDTVISTFNEHLRIHCLEIADEANGFPDDPEISNATIVVEFYQQAPIVRPADAEFVPERTTPPPSDANEVVVTLGFHLTGNPDAIKPCGPVPNWLAPVGFDLDGSHFQMTTRGRLE